MTPTTPGRPPALVAAADHRARGVITFERYDEYLRALTDVLPYCDGILASAQPLADLRASGALTPAHGTYLSLNRTGLARSAFEADDRLVASVARAAADGWAGVKVMVRIDLADARTASALEMLGRVLEEAAERGLEAMVESMPWVDGRLCRAADDVVRAAVVVHDMGAPLLKLPVPAVAAGRARRAALARVTGSVGAPVLFLGGPLPEAEADGPHAHELGRQALLEEVADVMESGAGMAVGRRLLLDPAPGELAKQLSEVVHRR